MYGRYHSLPPKPPKEKYVLGLSLVEAGWVLAGLIVSYKLLPVVPPLPIADAMFRKIHAFIPLFITAFFAFGKHPKTGLSLLEEIVIYFQFKARNKILSYKRGEY